jgi:hypothetical protein
METLLDIGVQWDMLFPVESDLQLSLKIIYLKAFLFQLAWFNCVCWGCLWKITWTLWKPLSFGSIGKNFFGGHMHGLGTSWWVVADSWPPESSVGGVKLPSLEVSELTGSPCHALASCDRMKQPCWSHLWVYVHFCLLCPTLRFVSSSKQELFFPMASD